MLISDSHQFIFIHVPKTAGTSIRNALAPYALSRPSGKIASLLKHINLPRDYRKFRFGTHCTLAKVEQKLPTEVFQNYKKIAFVRNPWDRLVSMYAYRILGTDDIDVSTFSRTNFQLQLRVRYNS